MLTRLALLLCVCSPASAQPAAKQLPPPAPVAKPKGTLLEETWDVVYILDAAQKRQKVGHVQTRVERFFEGDDAQVVSARQMVLEVRRSGDVARVSALSGTYEDARGRLIGVSGRQDLGPTQSVTLSGRVEMVEGRPVMKIVKEGAASSKVEIPWGKDVLGIWAEANLLGEKRLKPGEAVEYKHYDAQVNNVTRIRVTAGEPEPLSLPSGEVVRCPTAVAKPEKIAELQLPAEKIWLDPKTLRILQTEADVPGLGRMVVVRATKEQALAPNQELPDLFAGQSVRLAKRVPLMHERAEVTYRISFAEPVDATKIVENDARQRVKKIDDRTIEVTVKAVRGPSGRKATPAGAPDEGDSKANFFIASDDAGVKKLAGEAVGTEAERWAKARRVETWVKANMRPVNSSALETADHVAKTLRGDCTEYAMLSAAMCRAAGLPSRTVVGLVYAEDGRGEPVLAFHMWFEVRVEDEWLALDATRGLGSVGPGHIAIARSNWAGESSFRPLIPVTAFLAAKPKAEVVGDR
jgi:transglutaminase-like putative cysteine protease